MRITAGDVAGRLAIIGFYGWQADRLIDRWLATGQITSLSYLGVGLLIVICTARRRPATRIDQSWGARLIALAGTFAPFGFRPGGVSLVPDLASLLLVLFGLAFAAVALWNLGRNFGIVAAHRGLSDRGPYGLVRHPVYAGYVIMHAGFVAANFTGWNLLVWIVAEGAQIGRMLYEERTLRTSAAYAQYQTRVRYRLIPGLF